MDELRRHRQMSIWGAKLSTYFGRGRDERSPMGGMLDSAERYATKFAEKAPTKRKPGEKTLGPDGVSPVAKGVRLESLDARPTAEVRQQARDEPDYDAAFTRAKVKKVLDAVARSSVQARQVLEMLFGDSGWRCAQATGGKREDALFPLTKSYQAFRDKQAKRSAAKLELTEQQRIENTVADGVSVTAKRAVASARVEAKRIESEAWDVFFSVVEE